jgi:hypothetical protein
VAVFTQRVHSAVADARMAGAAGADDGGVQALNGEKHHGGFRG